VFSKVKTRVSLFLIAIAVGAATLTSVPALASATPIVWNQRGSTTCLSWYQGYNGRCYDVMRNGTKFRMWCWADVPRSYTGNYSSRRWFYGQSYNNGAWGWVHSSYVYYQTRVGHC
jgi:hypothetical protein